MLTTYEVKRQASRVFDKCPADAKRPSKLYLDRRVQDHFNLRFGEKMVPWTQHTESQDHVSIPSVAVDRWKAVFKETKRAIESRVRC
jgi:hypothetical protein